MYSRIFTYIVRENDTPFSIALKFNVPLETLLTLNDLKSGDIIYPLQKIKIPVTEDFYQIATLVESQCRYVRDEAGDAEETAADISVLNTAYKRYKVRRGDTVYQLAKEYNTTSGNILALNPQITDVRNLQIGSVITIPVPPKSSYIYVVRPGDTVYGIAKSQGVDTETVMQYNYLEADNTLYPGQQLVIVKN